MRGAQHRIQVDQALYGYQHGHQLLTSSRPFRPESQQQLLVLTDAAGPRIEGFDGYLSLFFLDAESVLVFAKTWFADEFSRPGCVWTHALFISEEQLALVNDLASVESAFRRPTIPYNRDYSSPLILNVPSDISDSMLGIPTRFTVQLFDTDKPVVRRIDSSDELNQWLFALWSIFWPKLRTRFSFSIGADEIRNVNGRPFDLTAVPGPAALRSHRLSPTDDLTLTDQASDWAAPLSGAAVDLNSRLRKFIVEFGHCFKPRRTALREIAELYSSIQRSKRNSDVATLIESLASLQSLAEPGPVLTALLNPLRSEWTPLQDPGLLLGLLNIRGNVALKLSSAQLDLPVRIEKLDRVSREIVNARVQESLEHSTGDVDELIRNAVVESILTQGAPISTISPSLWPLIVAEAPEKILEMDLDKLGVRSVAAMAEAIVASKTTNPSVISAVVALEMRHGLDQQAEQLYRSSADAAIEAAFSLADRKVEAIERLPFEWRRLFWEDPARVLRLFNHRSANRKSIRTLATLLPSRRKVSDPEREEWLVASPETSDDRLSFAVLELVAGLNDEEKSILLAASYENVYDGLRTSRLASYGWQMAYLEPRLPVLMPWDNWDKCRRLREAVAEHLIYNNLRPDDVLQSIERRSVRDDLNAALQSTLERRMRAEADDSF